MNALISVLAFAAACLAALIVLEMRPQPAAPDIAAPPSPLATATSPAPSPTLDPAPATLAATLLARPLFSQTRRPPGGTAPVATAGSPATPLPRMTGILIDGTRRSAIFATGSRPTVVAEGGRIGPFTVQTIEPQQVIVIGPEGKRTVRTSFDPSLQPPPAAPQPFALGAPQFPGILPGPVPGLPQPAGAAR